MNRFMLQGEEVLTFDVKAISLYDVRKAPLLDHYRLRVPRYRMVLEFFSFIVVFALAMVVLSSK